MKRWPTIVLIACAATVAVAEWFAPPTVRALLGGLLFVLVVLTAFSQRRALHETIRSLRTAHNEQIESERRYRALFDACSDAILVFPIEDDGRSGALVEVNEAACAALGYGRRQLQAMTFDEISAPEAQLGVHKHAQKLLEAGSLVFETTYLGGHGQSLPVEVNARLVEIRGRKLCLATARNIAARKREEELLRGLVHEDKLTGLLNRRGFFVMAEQAAKRARRLGVRVLLMYADVDGLKSVNDRLGHAAGDALVVAAAEALRLTFREDDVLARLGGDEFAALALLGSCKDERLDRETIARRLEKAVAGMRDQLGEEYAFSLSFGSLVASWEELGRLEELLALSDARMYEAKRALRRGRREAVPGRSPLR